MPIEQISDTRYLRSFEVCFSSDHWGFEQTEAVNSKHAGSRGLAASCNRIFIVPRSPLPVLPSPCIQLQSWQCSIEDQGCIPLSLGTAVWVQHD